MKAELCSANDKLYDIAIRRREAYTASCREFRISVKYGKFGSKVVYIVGSPVQC